MRSLLELEAFAVIAENLQAYATSISQSDTITLIIPPSPEGAVSSAFLEAALLDSEIPYRRRFSPRSASPPYIEVKDGDALDKPTTHQPNQFVITPLFATGVRGHDGVAHRGILSTVAQAAALAELISPDGKKSRSLRPWLLAGNWWAGALDQGYDPVYSALRDHLHQEGSVRVVPIPEIENPDMTGLKQIDLEIEASTRETWSALDVDAKANALSTLVLPQVLSEKPSTARLEELVWHRIKLADSESDLHTRMVAARAMWDGTPKAASVLIDSILSKAV
ncbi:MAG: hypothetical protein P8Q39_04925 [Candidatus Thalassarchaeaceae archaeon]|jgi:hypothetical protein|nr:hypothetical protein [Candidatus Thalassarchaeaceae archaeon]